MGILLNFLSLYIYRDQAVGAEKCDGTKADLCRLYGGYAGTRGYPLGYQKIVSKNNEFKASEVGYHEIPELFLNLFIWTSLSTGLTIYLVQKKRRT
jgi:hypothetical protein